MRDDHMDIRDYAQNGMMPPLRRAQLQALLDDYDRRVKHPGFYQRIQADNDANGNSRRLYITYNGNAAMTGVWRERYNRPRELDGLIELPSIKVGAGEYREWIEHASSSGVYHA